MVRDYRLSPSQGVQLLALEAMLKEGDVVFRAHDPEASLSARALIADVAQEIALQVPNEPQEDQ